MKWAVIFEIEFIGLRPGDKLFEELFIPGESYERTAHEKIFIAANASGFVPENLDAALDALVAAAARNDGEAIRRGLQALIPEYQTPQTTQAAASVNNAKPAPQLSGDPASATPNL